MTRTFHDESGKRWKAWLASREVFWPDPDGKKPDPDLESVLFVCFSDPNEPQRRARLPSGSFGSLTIDDLKDQFVNAAADPAIR